MPVNLPSRAFAYPSSHAWHFLQLMWTGTLPLKRSGASLRYSRSLACLRQEDLISLRFSQHGSTELNSCSAQNCALWTTPLERFARKIGSLVLWDRDYDSQGQKIRR